VHNGRVIVESYLVQIADLNGGLGVQRLLHSPGRVNGTTLGSVRGSRDDSHALLPSHCRDTASTTKMRKLK
jgi:hypothetical protein